MILIVQFGPDSFENKLFQIVLLSFINERRIGCIFFMIASALAPLSAAVSLPYHVLSNSYGRQKIVIQQVILQQISLSTKKTYHLYENRLIHAGGVHCKLLRQLDNVILGRMTMTVSASYLLQSLVVILLFSFAPH
jgi:hypothetical protein